MERVVTAYTPLPPDQLMFRAMHGNEALSQLFEFEVELVSRSHSLDMKALLGQPLTLEVKRESAGVENRYLSGQITRCVLVGSEGTTDLYYLYRATVRPWLWYLTQTSDSKIFQNKSVPEVIKDVLSDYDFPLDIKLAGNYRNWEYCVQYQETDFGFISRLMEHEGIYYWFKHENGKHTLVLTDDMAQHEAAPATDLLTYYAPDRAGTLPQEEFVSSWEIAEQITPGGFATVDYDFRKPGASLDARRTNKSGFDNSKLEVYEWLGGYTDPDHADHYTRVRLEDLQSRQEQIRASTNVRGIAPGYLFTLRNHPRNAENREYLIVSANYRIREGGYASGNDSGFMFDADVVVLPSSNPYRAPRLTPQPRTHGPQTARVVGKAGQQIWTDSYGRIKVQFHWDRYGEKNENSSCWVRVSSPWAGGGFGGIQLPRVNDEVIVDFIGGQPDRPIVIGRVYNASNMPPWDLPGNATQSGFLSRSQDGTPGTANAFMFEDKPGSEEIWMHAERNMRTEVEADELHKVDRNRSHIVGGFETNAVTGTRTTVITGAESATYQSGETRTISQGATEEITGGQTRTVTGPVGVTITGDVTRETTGNLTRTLKGDTTDTITGAIDRTHTGATLNHTVGATTSTVEGDITKTITGAVSRAITGDVSDTITGATTDTIDGVYAQTVTQDLSMHSDTKIMMSAPEIVVSTPKFTQVDPTKKETFAQTVVDTLIDWTQFSAVKRSTSIANVSATAIKGGVTGVNFDYTGMQMKNVPNDFRTTMLSLTLATAIRISVATAHLKT